MAEHPKTYSGPAFLSFGFRPFFLLGGLWAAAAMALWIAQWAGAMALPLAMTPLDWHLHSMLFGFLSAAIAGFLLTAVPNWTGRLPVRGRPLAGLVGLWVLGQAAILFSGLLPIWIWVCAAMLLPLALCMVISREILAGQNWRNLPVLAACVLLALAQGMFLADTILSGYAAGGAGARLGMSSVIGLLSLIGGRIVPSFTRNWLAKQGGEVLPTPMNRYDRIVVMFGAAVLLGWTVAPNSKVIGVGLLAVGVLHLVRIARWAGHHTFSEPLVAILHVGFSFVPIGFLILGAALVWPMEVPAVAGLHAWMAGAAGIMVLAVMTRASLGHTGRPLSAGTGVTAIYIIVVIAAVTRVIAAFLPAQIWLLHLSAAAWIGAFGLFVLIYWPILSGPKLGAKPVSKVRPS